MSGLHVSIVVPVVVAVSASVVVLVCSGTVDTPCESSVHELTAQVCYGWPAVIVFLGAHPSEK